MKFALSTIFSLVAFVSAFAQESVITLRGALAIALERNPSIRSATLETSRQTALKKTSFELPKTDVSMMLGQYNSIEKGDNNITISQSIPFPTLFGKQRGLHESLITSATLKESVSKNEVVFQVKQVFNQLLYLKLRHQLLVQQDSLMSDLLRIANLQYKTGEGTLLAKTSAETQLFEIQNQKSRNEADIQIALSHLQLLCQLPALSDVQGSLENFITLSEMDSTTTINLNPSLAYARQQIEVANWQRKVEAAKAMPDIRLGYFNQTLIGIQNINGRDHYFGSNKRFQGFQVGVSIPLWFAPHTARIKAASIATEVARKQNESFTVNLTQQYNQAIQELSKNRNSLSYYRSSALKTADLLIAQSRLAFKSGEVDHTVLLLNLKQALAIREGYLIALQQFNQSIIIIDYLNGKI